MYSSCSRRKSNSDAKSILKTIKRFYSDLAGKLLAKLLQAPNRYTIKFVSDYYKQISLSENFKLDSTTEKYLFKLWKNIEVTKAAAINQIEEKFLKDRVRILIKPISELCNLSVALESFPDIFKFAKVIIILLLCDFSFNFLLLL